MTDALDLVGPPRGRRGGPTVVFADGHPTHHPRRTVPCTTGKDRILVLPRPRRVNRPADFRRVLRRGRRCGRRRLVVHAHRTPSPTGAAAAMVPATAAAVSRAGLVVGRGVGSAVVRHRVSRRLRHLLADRLDLLPPGTDLVVRAQAPAAEASSAELGEDLDAALRRLALIGPGR